MPIYEYRCAKGHTFDVLQSMSDDPLTACEVCGAPVQKVLHAPAVHFKGSGFYNTDYGKGGKSKSAAGSSGSGDSGSSSNGSSESGDSGSSSGSDSGSSSGSGSSSASSGSDPASKKKDSAKSSSASKSD
jgi:putative FmdB family regulatory protein